MRLDCLVASSVSGWEIFFSNTDAMLFNGWSGRSGSDVERDGDVLLLCLLTVAVVTTEDILAATDDTLATTRDFFDSPPPVTLILDLVELLARTDFLDATTAAKLPSILGAAALAIDDLLNDIAELLERDLEDDGTLEATFCIEDPRLDEAAPMQPESLAVTVAASNSCIFLMEEVGC